MENNDNPYTILGVEKTASQKEIKLAYRKAALKFHPDKQTTDEGRKTATPKFAKISNAYEILGDEQQRREYDRKASGQASSKIPRQTSGNNGFRPTAATAAHSSFFHQTNFHDPFSVFEAAFQNDFGGDFFGGNGGVHSHHMNNMHNNMRQQQQQQQHGNFQGMGGGSMFGNNPFFGGGGMMGGGMMGGFGGGMFGAMQQQMNGMRNMQQNMMQQQQQQPGFQRSGYGNIGNPQQSQKSFSFTSSSNSMGGGGNRGESISRSTTTRVINGKRQVVTERVVRKADGTVERHVEESSDGALPGGVDQQLMNTSSAHCRSRPQVLEQASSSSDRSQPQLYDDDDDDDDDDDEVEVVEQQPKATPEPKAESKAASSQSKLEREMPAKASDARSVLKRKRGQHQRPRMEETPQRSSA